MLRKPDKTGSTAAELQTDLLLATPCVSIGFLVRLSCTEGIAGCWSVINASFVQVSGINLKALVLTASRTPCIAGQ